jgi:hypothetical protein
MSRTEPVPQVVLGENSDRVSSLASCDVAGSAVWDSQDSSVMQGLNRCQHCVTSQTSPAAVLEAQNSPAALR